MVRRRIAVVGVLAALLVGLPGVAMLPARAQAALTLWHPWQGAQAQALARWIADYEAENPGRTIRAEYAPFFALVNRFSAPAEGQDRPDMVLGPSDWAGVLANRRMLAQLDGRLNPAFRAQVADVAWRAVTFDAHILGVPVALEGPALYANAALLGDDSPPDTLADLLSAAAEHATDQSPGLIMGLDFYPTSGIFFALGGQLADAAGSSQLREGDALPAYLRTLQDVYRRSETGVIALNAPSDAFREGRTPFLLGGTWQLAELRVAPGDSLVVAPLPDVDGQPWSPLIRTWNLYMSLDSLRTDAAMDFARFVTGEAAQAQAAREAALVPANPNAWDADPDIRIMAESLTRAGVPIPNRAEMDAYWEPLRAMIRA
ncbi:MAG: extracellular solute-binding protein, partial [Anaerolineae bacterium]|nr:extracellular solute-binding protein [Anaerolineae bacterium]